MTIIEIAESEKFGLDRVNEPVTIGLPVKKGLLKTEDNVCLLRGEEALPVQTDPTAFWDDGTIKWLLIDYKSSIKANTECKYYLKKISKENNDTCKIEILDKEDYFIVNNGKADFFINKKVLAPISRVEIQGKIVVNYNEFRTILTDTENTKYVPEIDTIQLEKTGNLVSIIRVEGRFVNNQEKILNYISRIYFYSNQCLVKQELTLWNPQRAEHKDGLWDLGDKGSVYFKELKQEIELKNKVSEKSTCSIRSGENTLIQSSADANVSVYQASSGGENWNCSNHKNHLDDVPLSFKGYKVFENNKEIQRGNRVNPVIHFGCEDYCINATIEGFWQNFPKTVTYNNQTICLGLFPEEYSDSFELQGGERKTHTVYWDFSGKQNSLEWVSKPLKHYVDYKYFAGSSFLNNSPKELSVNNRIVESLIENSIEGENSFFQKRETIDEFGWRNFGDTYADHEAVGYKGEGNLVSHYNNQYDLLFGYGKQFIERKDYRFFQLFDELANHIADIDIYYTQKDKKEYNGGFFWHTNHYLDAQTCTHRSESKKHLEVEGATFCGGGPGMEHNYTQGLLLHYYLTGCKRSKEAILTLTDWVLNNIEEPDTIIETLICFKNNLNKWKQVFSGQQLLNIDYPFTRGTGNSVKALLDGYNLTNDRHYLSKAEMLIKGTFSPTDDISCRDISNSEIAWSYTVFLQSVGCYLDLKVDLGENDYMYWFARAALTHYTRWMLGNEQLFFDRKEILEYPNETWPAQDLRKSCVLYYGARYDQKELKDEYIKRAKYFFENAVKQINEFPTKHLARPIALVFQNYWVQSYIYNETNIQDVPDCIIDNSDKGDSDYLTRWKIIKYILKRLFTNTLHLSLRKEWQVFSRRF